PPDGQPGTMRMFIFTSTNPQRDGAMENAVVLHEMTHGLSSRLTGGSANANCLSSIIAGGLGEGWSDFVATTLQGQASDTFITSQVVGDYVSGNPGGVRTHPYSTDLTVNPLTYASLNDPGALEVHRIGEVWNSMLYEVYRNMVQKLGFTPEYKDATSGKGNTQALLTVINGIKMQPCNPNFVSARDAIIAADKALTGGKNRCDIVKGFSKRGLGPNA
ncbi:peptidase M36, partial [Blyttiomyces helicus]